SRSIAAVLAQAVTTLTIQPSEVITPYHIDGSAPAAPILRWSVTGGASVRVWGPGDGRPDGFTSNQRQGSAALCPVLPDDPVCSPEPGTYEYRIEVRAADGSALGAQTARLTILAPPIP
ncbi:MAG: hypothetical protein N2037_11575, partial [Acidimicrobiales bacterium]|nr:hypothetical protein [Acidimicrobiales bacterium]